MADDTTSVVAVGDTPLKSGRAGWRTDPGGKTTWTTATEGMREATPGEIAGKMGRAGEVGPGTQAGGAIWGYPPGSRLPGYTQAPSDADVVKLPSGAYQVSWEGKDDYDPRRGVGGPGGAILWYDPRKPRPTTLPSGTNLEQAIGRRIEEETRKETLTPEMARAAGRDPFDFAWGSRKQKLDIARRWGLDTTARRYLYGVAGTPEGGIDTGTLVEGYGKKGAVRELQVLGVSKDEAQSRVRLQDHISDGRINIVEALEDDDDPAEFERDLAVMFEAPEIARMMGEARDYIKATVKLDTGDRVDKDTFEALGEADKGKLMRGGVGWFTRSQALGKVRFEKENLQLGTGEWVPRKDFGALLHGEQILLTKLGVDRYNAVARARDMMAMPGRVRMRPEDEPQIAWGAEVGDRPTTAAVTSLRVPTRVPTGAWPGGFSPRVDAQIPAVDVGPDIGESSALTQHVVSQMAGVDLVPYPSMVPSLDRPFNEQYSLMWASAYRGLSGEDKQKISRAYQEFRGEVPFVRGGTRFSTQQFGGGAPFETWPVLGTMTSALEGRPAWQTLLRGAGDVALIGGPFVRGAMAPLRIPTMVTRVGARTTQLPGVRQTLGMGTRVGGRISEVPGVRQVISPVTTVGGRAVPRIAQVALRTGKVIGATGGAAMLTTGVGAVGVGALTAPPRVDPTRWTKLDAATVEAEVAPYKKATGFVSIADGTETTYSIDVDKMVDDYGWERTTRLLASMEDLEEKPPLERGIWEKLGTGSQALYEPTARRDPIYEKGIFGAWGRGTKRAYTPVTEWLGRKGLPGQLGAGMFSYMVPHEMASELYKAKGPVAFAALTPHFGPTAIQTGLTWKEQSLFGKVSGIGFAALPFAVGPAGVAATRVGTFVGKIPVVGPISRIAYKPIGAVAGTVRGVERFGKEQIGIPTLGEWAPWRMAYTVSGLGGKLGLAGVPKVGPAGVKWGWWKKPPTGVDPFGERFFTEFPEAQRIYIDIEKAMAGPVRPAQPTLRQLTGKQRAILDAGGKMEYSVRGTWEVVPPEGHVAFRGSQGKTVVRSVEAMTPAEWDAYRLQTYGPRQPWTPGQVRWPARSAEVRLVDAPTQYLKDLFSRWKTPAKTAARVAPRVAMVAPVVGVAAASVFAPAVAVAVDVPQLVKQDMATLDQMLREDAITASEHSRAVEEISRIEARDVTVQEYLNQVDVVVSDTLTPEQVEAYQVVREQQVDLEKVRVTDQQLGQMEQVQQEQMQQVQEQLIPQYEVQHVLWDEQTQMREQVEEEQAKFRAQIGLPLVPLLPFMAGPKMGFGWAGGRRFGPSGSGAIGAWEAPGMVISAPHPLGGEVVTSRFGKFRRKYGAVAPRQQVAGLKGIRAS